MDSFEIEALKYFKSIVNLKNNIKNNLLSLVLCLPKIEYLLFNILLNVEHFKEKQTIFDTIINVFNERTNEKFILPRLRYKRIKSKIIYTISKKENITLRKNY